MDSYAASARSKCVEGSIIDGQYMDRAFHPARAQFPFNTMKLSRTCIRTDTSSVATLCFP